MGTSKARGAVQMLLLRARRSAHEGQGGGGGEEGVGPGGVAVTSEWCMKLARQAVPNH